MKHSGANLRTQRQPAISPSPDKLSAALAQHQSGRLAEAERLYRQVLAANPRHSQALYFLGVLMHQSGRLDQAARLIGKAISLDPHSAAYPFSLANVLLQQRRLEDAGGWFRKAIKLDPTFPDAHNNLGNVLWEQGKLQAAAICFRTAVALNPDLVEAHNNLGNALRAGGAIGEAVAAYRAALARRPDFHQARNNLGTALADQGDLDASLDCFRTVLSHQPDCAEALGNMGTTLEAMGQRDEAIGCYRKALALRPDDADVHTNLGLALLAQGNFQAGWAEHEWRWHTRRMSGTRPVFNVPQWQGEVGNGRTLLIHAEQGLGDTLQFCRFATLARQRGFKVVMQVQPALVRLLSGLQGVDGVIGPTDPLPAFDLHCPMMSLPLALATEVGTIPAYQAYVRADAAAVAAWQTKLSGSPGRRVGVAWAGAPHQAADRRRSMPVAHLAALTRCDDVQVFSLQKDSQNTPAFMTDVMHDMRDLADTAALIACLDLVISVDTSVLHLAAALGKPVWLLDRFDPCWRWMSGRRDSPWYPTLRIYRQPAPGDWDAVMADVVRDLQIGSLWR